MSGCHLPGSCFPISQNLDPFLDWSRDWPHILVNLTKLIFCWLEIIFFSDYFPLLELYHRLTFKKLKTSRNLILIHLNCFVYGPFLWLPWLSSLVPITATSLFIIALYLYPQGGWGTKAVTEMWEQAQNGLSHIFKNLGFLLPLHACYTGSKVNRDTEI